MRKIAVITGTRADYGLLKNVMREINDSNKLELELIVTGTHLSKDYGYTIKEIIKNNFKISKKIDILSESNSIPASMGLLMIELSNYFLKNKPDVMLILGDRYEIFASASVGLTMNIPIAHISGGEITEGAIDDQIRHAITKMASIHFPGAKQYSENLSKLGEESFRIYNVGDPGIENIKTTNFLSKKELSENLKFNIDDGTLLITYHSVTLEINELPKQIDELLIALENFSNKMIITYPNADEGGIYIIKRLKKFAQNHSNVLLVESLGIKRYLSVMKICAAVVGNSSSALVEAPYLKVPVVNIGDRQKGRLKADNIISCNNSSKAIIESMYEALSKDFKDKVLHVKSLYGDGNTSKEIVKVLETIELNEKLLKKKLTWR